ncbi:type II toxin-antitoxin system VapC family toxin [Microcoleus sp. C2C3]|uniref:type II toxin-antitoxin system VapC family toxin n=1 Tax=unclassified Microcoleus TaxID=2642155 RepID=UPI002FD575B6
MSSICLIDTSIFLEILNVPNYNQHRASVLEDFKTYSQAGCTFLLPMATILETGNHIAQNGDGTLRRKTAIRFVEQVKAAFAGIAPWRPTPFPSTAEILEWIDQFPDEAGKNKAPNKQEGTSFGDLSIIQEFQKSCNIFSMSEVFIWSLDKDLENYHQMPT